MVVACGNEAEERRDDLPSWGVLGNSGLADRRTIVEHAGLDLVYDVVTWTSRLRLEMLGVPWVFI